MLGDLRVALVRHGDRAHRARGEGLTQLADLGPLQLVHLVADLAHRGRAGGQQPDELGDPVPGGQPRDVRRGQAEPFREPVQQVKRAFAPELHRAQRPAELDHLPAGTALAQALQVTVEFGGPDGRLEPERDRQARLPVGAAAHRRVAVGGGQLQGPVPHAGQVPFGDVAQGPEHQGEPGVGQVLHGGAVVDPLPGLVGQRVPQGPDQAHGGMPGGPGLLRDQVQVQLRGVGVRGYGRGGGGGIRPTSAWAWARAARIRSQAWVRPWSENSAAGFWRGPQVPVDGRVGGMGAGHEHGGR